MEPSRFSLARLLSPPTMGGVVSGLVHFAGIAAIAAWATSEPDQRVRYAGAQSVTSIQMTASPPRSVPETFVTIAPADAPVIIEPRRAELEGSVLVEVPAQKVTTEAAIERILHEPELATVTVPAAPPSERQQREEGSPPPASAKSVSPTRAARHKPPVTTLTARTNDLPASNPSPQSTLGTDQLLPPSFAGNSPPRYPEQARRSGWQGMVLLRLTVGIDGRVKTVEIAQSSGYELLDAEALRAVQAWRGAPATRGGRPIESVEILPVRFRLRG